MGNIFGSPEPKDDNLETFHLVWLDPAADDTVEDEKGRQFLRTSINHLRKFKDAEKCEQYIQNVSKSDRIVFVVTGRLGQELMPRIHQLRQISSIYIYCMDKDYHEEWSKDFTKVKLDDLVAKIRQDQITRIRNKVDEPLSISIFDPNIDNRQWTTGTNTQFIYSQLLIDFFLRMKPTAKDKTDLISLCKKAYLKNDPELAIVHEFQRDYQASRALWWYTRDSFLPRLLNKALRVQNTDLLLLFRFFIHDIDRQLQNYQCTSVMHVYRSQLMSIEELQIFKDSIGKFIAMTSFLSTILNRDQAINFVKTLIPVNELQHTLFEIEANPQSATSKSFANITAHSYNANEEVLFMAGSIFQLIDIRCDDNQVWVIRMKLSNEDDQNLKPTFDYIKKDQKEEINLFSFINILRRLGKFDEAEKYCLRLSVELPANEYDLAVCYDILGSLAREKNDLETSIKWYRKSLEYATRNPQFHDPRLAANYTTIAGIYRQKNDYKQALEYYNKALTMAKEVFGKEHVCIAEYYTNVGTVYQAIKQWFEALDYYLKALVIQQKQSSMQHTQISQLLNNMADCHTELGLYDLALSHYDLSLKTLKASELPQNRNMASTLHKIGYVYEKKNDLQQTLSYYQQAADIYRHTLTPTHSTFMQLEQDIQRISSQLK
ncbi:unnamed protein product [Rotaria sp. Silwood1]|nr:unnamed protein product [Rotaria sp. Silwood1]CAF1003047.1 unnamed protein product [Rotaria sp. Silwood1]CAF1011893.1 unnamed protein product [Rotaria sp. Silwood1]CAF3396968.1 unnamed protein product [Rotaria sp. Silwood1]CAF3411550.1 unnamed protein product [Rotaria sp. Silwood1]